LEDAGKKSEALRYFSNLSEKAQTALLKAEASVSYGLLLRSADSSKAVEAVEAMKRALEVPGTEARRGDLRLGILETLDSTGSYPKVIESFQSMESLLEGPYLARALEIAGTAHARMKQHAKALELFDRLLATAPDIASGSSVRYQRLICLYNLNAKDVLREIDAYMSSNPPPSDRVNALLMKAEVLRLRKDFAAAAGVYALVVNSKGVEANRWTDALLRWAQCAVGSGYAPQTI
jgi:tetratricopeptide (TPR) repeat protein